MILHIVICLLLFGADLVGIKVSDTKKEAIGPCVAAGALGVHLFYQIIFAIFGVLK